MRARMVPLVKKGLTGRNRPGGRRAAHNRRRRLRRSAGRGAPSQVRRQMLATGAGRRGRSWRRSCWPQHSRLSVEQQPVGQVHHRGCMGCQQASGGQLRHRAPIGLDQRPFGLAVFLQHVQDRAAASPRVPTTHSASPALPPAREGMFAPPRPTAVRFEDARSPWGKRDRVAADQRKAIGFAGGFDTGEELLVPVARRRQGSRPSARRAARPPWRRDR